MIVRNCNEKYTLLMKVGDEAVSTARYKVYEQEYLDALDGGGGFFRDITEWEKLGHAGEWRYFMVMGPVGAAFLTNGKCIYYLN